MPAPTISLPWPRHRRPRTRSRRSILLFPAQAALYRPELRRPHGLRAVRVQRPRGPRRTALPAHRPQGRDSRPPARRQALPRRPGRTKCQQSYDQRFRVLQPGKQAIQEALQDALTLPDAPRRIECFDISHIQGSETVASMVVWEDGAMKKSDYRKFKLAQASRA